MINHIILIGRLTDTPQLKTTKSDKKYTKFTIAVNNNNNAYFIDSISWNKNAEFICKYFKKGNKIFAEGQIETSTYEKYGKNIKSTYINVNSVQFVEPKKDNQDLQINAEEDLPF